jgi:hypothetical protein
VQWLCKVVLVPFCCGALPLVAEERGANSGQLSALPNVAVFCPPAGRRSAKAGFAPGGRPQDPAAAERHRTSVTDGGGGTAWRALRQGIVYGQLRAIRAPEEWRRGTHMDGPYVRWSGRREGPGSMLTINVALLLIIVVVLRLRRRTQARSRVDEQMTVVIVLALGVLLAPTQFGHGMVHVISGLAHSVSQVRI